MCTLFVNRSPTYTNDAPMKNSRLLLILLLLVMATPTMAAERVLDFASTVRIQADGALLVTEKITVEAAGQQIKRGIVREFPTRYKDTNGQTVRVGFTLLAVKRDGHPEPYHLKHVGNGVAIYAGSADVWLRPGRYTYTIAYTTTRQLGFFEKHDELYWNVNGNGWRLPMDKVSCEVFLPQQAVASTGWAYEGAKGSKERFRLQGGNNRVYSESTRPYAPGEGLTIAVGWPKGFVAKPSATDQAMNRLTGWGSLAPAALGFCLLLAYYVFAWLKVGRDPAKGIVIPRFAPPKGFSPAMVRMLWKMRFDNTAFTAGIINIAVHGGLTLSERDTISLELTSRVPSTLSAGERSALNELHKGGMRIQLKDANHRIINRAQQAMKDTLSKELASTYFLTNSLWTAPGIALTLLATGAMAWAADEPPLVFFLSIWLTGWTFGCFTLIRQVRTSWKARGVKGRFSAILFALFAVPFLGGEVVGIAFLSTQIGLVAGAVLLAMMSTNALFYTLLKAPTKIGQTILDEIEGFKLYLSVAEKDRLNLLHPPEETPQLFEHFLPYAIALEVENRWGERFAGMLTQAGYTPQWYSGGHWNQLHPATFATALGSGLQSAISSASTAPGSSSGMSGGGSSGGGGGGGGGGGW